MIAEPEEDRPRVREVLQQVTDLDVPVSAIMVGETFKRYPEEKAQDAARAFERYDPITAIADGGGFFIYLGLATIFLV